jgi:hypothetical protein
MTDNAATAAMPRKFIFDGLPGLWIRLGRRCGRCVDAGLDDQVARGAEQQQMFGSVTADQQESAF